VPSGDGIPFFEGDFHCVSEYPRGR
jgi:hypothetical protein